MRGVGSLRGNGEGVAVVAGRIWLSRVPIAISVGQKKLGHFIIYFPGLVNWSVGENKELNFLVAAAAAVVGVVVAVAVAAVVDACLYVV